MTSKQTAENMENKVKLKLEFVPPDGGWGYFIAVSMTLMLLVTVIPMICFGIIYGEFMERLGDAASGTAIVNGVFFTVFSFTGLLANYLLQKYSCRNVGLIGSVLYCIGSFSTIFVHNFFQIVVSFAIIQGLGFGILMPACFASFGQYFSIKKNFVMSISMTILSAASIAYPAMATFLMGYFGFRGTLALVSAFGANCFVAVLLLDPVEWHMKRKLIEVADTEEARHEKSQGDHDAPTKPEGEVLIADCNQNPKVQPSLTKQRPSVISVGSIGYAVSKKQSKRNLEDGSFWQKLSKSLSLDLFKDAVFINISAGIALAVTADVAFISLMPILLNNRGFSADIITFLMTLYFIGDLIGRIILTTVTAFIPINNRIMFIIGCIIPAILRTGFLMYNSYTYIATIATFLGIIRCLVQVLCPLVIAEAYPVRFAEAFSLSLVIQGCISLVVGPALSSVKTLTGSDEAVVHLLTASYLLCAVPWTLEIMYQKMCGKKV